MYDDAYYAKIREKTDAMTSAPGYEYAYMVQTWMAEDARMGKEGAKREASAYVENGPYAFCGTCDHMEYEHVHMKEGTYETYIGRCKYVDRQGVRCLCTQHTAEMVCTHYAHPAPAWRG